MKEMDIGGTPYTAGRWPFDPSLPTVIFIHGAAGSKKFWELEVEGLAVSCNTIAFDLPGHGDNSGDGFDSIDAYADAAENFIKTINPPSPVICGLSMGGAVVLKLLLDGKIKYRAGIIINSGAKLKVMPSIFELIQNNYQGYISALPSMGASPKTDRAKLADIIADAERSVPAVSYGDFTACNTFDVTGRLGEIKTHTLVLTAEDDRLAPVKLGRFIHDNVSGSEYVNIAEAGHFSPVEKPDEVNDAIRIFLQGID